MKYETIKFNVGSEQYDVIHCLGDGQCECKSCKDKNKWSIAWTSWFYKLNETDEHVLCRDCLMEVLIQRRIGKATKETVKEVLQRIESGLAYYQNDDVSCEFVFGIMDEIAKEKGVIKVEDVGVSPKELRATCNYYEYGCKECSAGAICRINKKDN